MTDEYKPSDYPIDELEKNWLQWWEDELDHLHMHQCSNELLAFEEEETPDYFKPLFKHIGESVGLSPSDVKERLCAAKKAGILSLGGHQAVDVGARLAKRLNEVYGGLGKPSTIERVIVGTLESLYEPRLGDQEAATARAAADYFVNVVPSSPMGLEEPEDEDNEGKATSQWVGFCGGKTILKMIDRIIANPRHRYDSLSVWPLAGEADPVGFQISANSVVAHLAHPIHLGKIKPHALMGYPYIGPIDSKDYVQWQARHQEDDIQNVVKAAKRVKFAFLGVGEVQDEQSAIQRLKRYCKENTPMPGDCVGDMCYRPMNREGKDVWPQLSNRVVGLTLDDLHKMTEASNRRVFAVACGTKKVEGIIAAVVGGLVNGLITDELTALEILDKLGGLEKEPPPKAASKKVIRGKHKVKAKKAGKQRRRS